MRPFGMVEPRMQPLAALLALGQMLEQHAAGDPAAVALFGRQADEARDLLGLGEIALRRLGQAVALQRDDPLVALVGRRLVEGDRQIALAEQGEQRRVRPSVGQPLGIVADIAAQLAAEIIAHQQVDDAALGLRLERHLALRVLEQRAEQGGQHQRLGEQSLDHRRIAMVGQTDLVEHRPDARQPAARMARRNRDAERDVGDSSSICLA